MDSPTGSKSSLLGRSTLPYLIILVISNLTTFFLSTSFPTACLHYSSTIFSTPANPDSPEALAPTEIFPTSDATATLPPEFLAFASPRRLPFGHNHNFGSDTMRPPAGHPCALFPKDLTHYMSYAVNGTCPDDEQLGQQLLLKGCEPLPRRRCRAVSPKNYVNPKPVPESHWSIPSDSSLVWTAYTCKSYGCLVDRKNHREFSDCKDCFDLQGRESHRWIHASENSVDFTIDEVVSLRPPGTVRIGLDIGGGTGTFAVRMRERWNVTVITTSMNLDGPFNNFIASRGVVPLFISVSQRLPFFDNTLDIVHSMHVLSNWIPDAVLHFLLFDVYRVIRPGGIFWLDHFFCVEEQLEKYIGLIDSVGFGKVKWVVGRKLDRGEELKEMYISAVLEKPLSN